MPAPEDTRVDLDGVVWRLADPDRELDGVRLWSDFDLEDTAFERRNGGWELRRARHELPAVDRLEYLFEVTQGGETRSMLDPQNPRRVGGAFGDHSWLPFGYEAPGWLDLEPVEGNRRPLVVDTPVGEVHVELWSPTSTQPTDVLPLLLCHDGPEMDTLGELTRFVGAMIALRQAQGTGGQAQGTGGLPAMRVALLAPGARDVRYAANPAYADALCDHVVPAVLDLAPTDSRPVLMGQSLGALAALHAEWTHPGTFGGLVLQSGSFFMLEHDAHEMGYAGWGPVSRFVSEVMAAERAPSILPVAVCFGTAEENAANNRQLATKLAALGCPVTVGTVRDGHNFTCWRDLLDPHLVELLTLRQAQGAS